ncbi:MAG: sodium:solute symporter family protein [Candidatus Ranarchaeia archaeon]
MQSIALPWYFVAIVIFFGVLSVLGYLAKRSTRTGLDFIISGRNLGLVLCTVAVAGEWLGGTSTIGVSEIAYNHGFAPFIYNIGTAIGMMIFGLTLAIHYRRRHVHTVPEMIEQLYDRKTRLFSAFFFSIGYFTLVVAQLVAAGSLIGATLGIDPALATFLTGITISILVTGGGLWFAALSNLTDVALGYTTLIISTVIALIYIGGFQGLYAALPPAVAPVYFSPVGDIPRKSFEWLLGGAFGALAAQASIQPIFGAKDLRTARRASLLTPMLVAPMGLLSAILGIIAYAITPTLSDPKLALPLLLMNPQVIPPIIGALTLASVFGLIAGTSTSILLALGSIIAYDIFPAITGQLHLRDASGGQKKLLHVSRISTLLIGIAATSLAFTMPSILDTSYISYALRSAAALIIIAGIYWKGRVTNKMAIGTLVVSLITTLIWYISGSPFGISKVEISLYSAILFLMLSLVAKKISMLLPRSRGAVKTNDVSTAEEGAT